MVGRLMMLVYLALVVLAGGCNREQGGGKKLLLLAIDGMDYTLLRGLMEDVRESRERRCTPFASPSGPSTVYANRAPGSSTPYSST